MILVVLLGCCGLGLDIGMLELKRLQMQNAADAAAMGAMMESERGNSDWLVAGRLDSGLNGFTNGVNGVSVTITNPPATGGFITNNAAFQAIVSQPVTALFMGKSITVQAQATAVMPPCGYLMATSVLYPTMWLQSANIYALCPVYSSQYLLVDGFAKSRYDANYVGGTAAASAGSSGGISGPVYNYPQMADPLSYVASPSFSSCTYIGLPNILIPTTLNPGTYCNLLGLPGLTVIATTVTFNPGLYIITGGMSLTGATLNGTGVTMYMTKRTDFPVVPAYGTISIQSSTINLSAPNDTSGGGVTAVLIFGDRNWVPTGTQDIGISSSTFAGDGIIYFPKAGIYSYNSNIVPPNYFGLVVDNVHEFFGNIHLASNFSNVIGGNPFRPRETLVE